MAGGTGEANPPEVLELPIGLEATGTRKESDSLGEIDVPPTATGVHRRSAR